FIHAGAVHYVQPDVVRLAGVTEWWQVADLAHSYQLPVVPHVGDMAQVHQHLCIAHPACRLLEYIPWLRDWMRHPAKVADGSFVAPTAPGAGTEPTARALPTIVVNNAGNHLKRPALELTDDAFQSVMAVHVNAAFALARDAAGPMLAAGRGSVLFLASMASYMGVPQVAAYTAAKCAVVG